MMDLSTINHNLLVFFIAISCGDYGIAIATLNNECWEWRSLWNYDVK
jgi:hypothetical protein